MRTFIENYLHFMKNCIRPHYEKLKPLKSGFIENTNFENNRDPWCGVSQVLNSASSVRALQSWCRKTHVTFLTIVRKTRSKKS